LTTFCTYEQSLSAGKIALPIESLDDKRRVIHPDETNVCELALMDNLEELTIGEIDTTANPRNGWKRNPHRPVENPRHP
jgi:hypothetical protein